MTTLIFFNLLANATFSFWIGLILVYSFIHLFRIKTGPWQLFLLTLPFLKVIYDFSSGVPDSSILMQGLDPFKVQPGHQSLSLGVSATYWGPTLQLIFTVRDLAQNQFAASAGDYLFFWLSGKNPLLPNIVLFVAASPVLLLIARRLQQAYQFELVRRKDRKLSTQLKVEKVAFRKVDIYISQGFMGTPFTGGVFQPYICIPNDTYKNLTTAEIAAVIAHEIGHIRQFDIAFTVFIQFLGDIFWFIPGYRKLSRKIDHLREIIADQFAVQSGIRGEYLASALLKLKEIPYVSDKFTLYSAFSREKSLLKMRILHLLGEANEKHQRFGWNFIWVRVLFSVWITSAVLTSSLAGNHNTNLKAPIGLMRLLTQYLGIQAYKE